MFEWFLITFIDFCWFIESKYAATSFKNCTGNAFTMNVSCKDFSEALKSKETLQVNVGFNRKESKSWGHRALWELLVRIQKYFDRQWMYSSSNLWLCLIFSDDSNDKIDIPQHCGYISYKSQHIPACHINAHFDIIPNLVSSIILFPNHLLFAASTLWFAVIFAPFHNSLHIYIFNIFSFKHHILLLLLLLHIYPFFIEFLPSSFPLHFPLPFIFRAKEQEFDNTWYWDFVTSSEMNCLNMFTLYTPNMLHRSNCFVCLWSRNP